MKKIFKIILFVLIGLVSSILIFTYICPAWLSFIVGNYTCKDISIPFNEINIDKNLILEGNELQGFGVKVRVKEKYETISTSIIKVYKNDKKSVIINEPITHKLEEYFGEFSLQKRKAYFAEIQKKYNVVLNTWFDYRYLDAKVTNKDFSLFNNKQNVFVANKLQVSTIIPAFNNGTDFINSEKYKGFLYYSGKELCIFQFYKLEDLNTEYQIVFSKEFTKEEIIEIISTLEFTS